MKIFVQKPIQKQSFLAATTDCYTNWIIIIIIILIMADQSYSLWPKSPVSILSMQVIYGIVVLRRIVLVLSFIIQKKTIRIMADVERRIYSANCLRKLIYSALRVNSYSH
jgi:hypothetical protein